MQRCLSPPPRTWATPTRSNGQVSHTRMTFYLFPDDPGIPGRWGKHAVATVLPICGQRLQPYPRSLCPSAARPYTLSEIITIGIVAAVLVVAVVGGVIACAVRARSYRSAEGLEPLLGETFRRYSEDDRRMDKTQSVV